MFSFGRAMIWMNGRTFNVQASATDTTYCHSTKFVLCFVGKFSFGDRYLINERDVRNPWSVSFLSLISLPSSLGFTLSSWWQTNRGVWRGQGLSTDYRGGSIHHCSGASLRIPSKQKYSSGTSRQDYKYATRWVSRSKDPFSTTQWRV